MNGASSARGKRRPRQKAVVDVEIDIAVIIFKAKWEGGF